jgi:hypothetical protein
LRKNRTLKQLKAGFFEPGADQQLPAPIIYSGKPNMFYALSWFAVLILLALWSLAAWGFHAIAAWTISNAAGLKGGSSEILSQGVPAWLAPWMPPELASTLPAMVSSLTPVVDFLLGLAPGLAGVLSVAVWVAWAIGSVLLIVLGFVLSGVIAMLRRRRSA